MKLCTVQDWRHYLIMHKITKACKVIEHPIVVRSCRAVNQNGSLF